MQEILDKIYLYYPVNCNPFSEDYDQSPQTTLKLATISKLKRDFSPVHRLLLNRLKATITGYELTDQTAIYDREFCNYLSYTMQENNLLYRLHLLISVLHPVHCVLVSAYNIPGQQLIAFCDYGELKNHLKIDGILHKKLTTEIATVNKIVKELAGTEEVKMSQLNKIFVPGIQTQDRMNEVSLFDLLFTSYFHLY
jgi:hypothetical protein